MFQSYLDLAGDPGKEGELGKMKNTSNKPTHFDLCFGLRVLIVIVLLTLTYQNNVMKN